MATHSRMEEPGTFFISIGKDIKATLQVNRGRVAVKTGKVWLLMVLS